MTNYPSEIEPKIDFISIREQLKEHCSFAPGREEVEDMRFLTDFEAVQLLLDETREMQSILEDKSLGFP